MQNKKQYLPKLLEFIDLANLIPKDFIFPNWLSIFNTIERYSDRDWIGAKDIFEYYQKAFRDLPETLQIFILSDISYETLDDSLDSWDLIEATQKRIELLSSLKYGLVNLAQFVTEEYLSNDGELKIGLNDYFEGLNKEMPNHIADLKVEISVTKDGFIQVNSTEFYELITTYKIEARRIRTCVICTKIFWANRIDKWTCSKVCGNILRQRNWQMENREKYNKRRRKNYAYKQKTKKQKEEKKNGDL